MCFWRFLFYFGIIPYGVCKWVLILKPFKLFAWKRFGYFKVFACNTLNDQCCQWLCKNPTFPRACNPCLHVLHFRVCHYCKIKGYCPGGCCPDNEVLVRLSFYSELHKY